MKTRHLRVALGAALLTGLVFLPADRAVRATSNTHVVYLGCASSCRQYLVLDDSGGANPVPITDAAVTTSGGDEGFEYSPDGTKIAFSRSLYVDPSTFTGFRGVGIFIEDAGGGNLVQATFPISFTDHWGYVDYTRDRSPSWSPDGTKIAFRRTANGATGILIVDLTAPADNNLTLVFGDGITYVDDPDWSPNGNWIAFTVATSSWNGLVRIHPDSTVPEAMVAGGVQGPSWSPDGSKIAYHSSGTGGSTQGIYVANEDGTNPQLIRTDPHCCTDWYFPQQSPQWSSDGTRIAFVGTTTSNSYLGVMNADGSNADNFVFINGTSIPSFDWEPAAPAPPPPPPTDTDSDSVPDDQDNCPSIANLGQADADNDGIGDVCDPDYVTLSIANASTDEGNVGAGNLPFVVTMTGPRAVDVTVQYQTADVTASDDSDYTAASGVLTIHAGQTTGTINVAIARDVTFEADETFTVELIAATNATIDDGLATGTIVNDDLAQSCRVPLPILEYRFNETGTTAPSTGTDTTAVTFMHPAGTVVDLHGVPGSGISGLAGDIAFDNTGQVNDGVPDEFFGLGGYGDRAEQPADDNSVDSLASVTFQGWFNSNDPVHPSGESGILFNKSDGVGQGAGFDMRWIAGTLRASVVTDAGGGSVDSPQSYFSGNQWIFFAITYDGTSAINNLKFYRGTSLQSVALVHTATLAVGPVRDAAIRLVLGNGANAVRAFPALFDNMRIFGSQSADTGVLTPAQLEGLRLGDVQNTSDPVAYGCDTTPPVVTPTVTGSSGNNGWYIGDVSVTWSVVDNESPISSTTACDATSITTDTAGTTLTCSATSAGGTTSESVTIKRDATPPSSSAAATPPPNPKNWRKTDVTVSFSGSDALSAVTCDPDVVLTTDGANQSASGQCYDAAGNASVLATASGINIDKTPPSAAPAADPPANGAGWRKTNVTVTFSGVDALSGNVICDSGVITAEGTNLGAGGYCYDDAGNQSALATIAGINIDKTPPSAGATPAPAANAAGWNNTNVSVSFGGTDALSGIASCDPAVVLSANGASQSASGRCYDAAGNQSAPATANGINIDKTPPSAIVASVLPLANAAGWRKANVTVSFSGTDALSGIDHCDSLVLSADGANQSASGRCYDAAGNQSAVATASGINIDKTPPTTTASAGPPANSFGWRKTNVTVTFSGVDALSGIAGCSSAVIMAEGVNLGASGVCNDAAGNQSALVTITGINIDKTAPTIALTSPANGAVFNRNQVVTASYTCNGGLSTNASCVGSVATGAAIDTSKKAQNAKFTVTATDMAGNTTKTTVTYSVK